MNIEELYKHMGDAGRAEVAHEVEKKIERALQGATTALEIGELLLFMRETKLYKYLADTFLAWLSSLDIAQRTAYMMMELAEFANECQNHDPGMYDMVMRGDTSKLMLVMKPVRECIRDGKMSEARDWLVRAYPVRAGGLSRKDLIRMVRETGHTKVTTDLYVTASRDGRVCGMVRAVNEEDVSGDIVIAVRRICRGREWLEALCSTNATDSYDKAQEA